MTNQITTVIEPFVQRGLFENFEKAVTTMAYDYVLHQVERYQTTITHLQNKYGMDYEHFEAYLKARSTTLAAAPNLELNQAIMLEEEDALNWKIARDMLASWLGVQLEVKG
ncbi:MAG: hypothetical protein U9Q82_12450 [Chloroflexota bacterium]|nr:hypothetical protein [Chloroflexota bacterium]